MKWIEKLEALPYPVTIVSHVKADKTRYWSCSINCGPYGSYSSEEYIHIKDAVLEILAWVKERSMLT